MPPPEGYEKAISRERAEKDRMFRYDSLSPLAESLRSRFEGLEYYPVEPLFRFVGRVEPLKNPRRVVIPGTRGERRVAERWALFAFETGGTVRRLMIYRMYEPGQSEPHPFLAFSDATTGRETYPAGRYVDPEIATDGVAVVDFNRAYNPWCAYGKQYDCPFPPAENRLDIPIRAGERGRAHGAGDAH